MRSTTTKITSEQFEVVDWSEDLPVYKPSVTGSSPVAVKVPCFGDDFWALHEMQWKTTATTRSISFLSYPERWKNVAKRIAWCMLNIEAPIVLITRPHAARTRLTKGTVVATMMSEIKPFLLWLNQRGVLCLSEVSEATLRLYGEQIAASKLSRHYKQRRLWGPTRLWLYARYLPVSDQLSKPPWETAGTADLIGPANWSAENRTEPIHPQTMSSMLVWARLFVEQFSSEIINVIELRDDLRTRCRSYSYDGDQERLEEYLDHFHETWNGLPGHLSRRSGQVQMATQFVSVVLGVGTNRISAELGKRISSGQKLIDVSPFMKASSLVVHGKKVCTYFDYYRVDEFKRLLSTACMIVIAYLTGMRCEEWRGLQRGCCEQIQEGGVSRYEISARSYKDAIDSDGNTIPGGRVREEPWHVIEPVAKAIKVMEALHKNKYLFNAAELQPWSKLKHDFVVDIYIIQKYIDFFVSWCNHKNVSSNLSSMAIPDDPSGRVTARRFRRTLAWFIYRQPAGRIALGIQYGHLLGITSDGYGSRVSTGLRDLFPMEEAFARADSIAAAAERLSNGEGVSGPAAERYVRGVEEFTQRFQGKYLSVRQAAELQRDPVFRIYDNGMQPLACCYDSSKALCHPDREAKQPFESTPNLSRCDTSCPNAARTDTHIKDLERERKHQLQQCKSELNPEPLRLRHKQRADSIAELIKKHKKNRSSTKESTNV